MKVTVAFGDVKVVVPCGNGDITIRQLSELAVTRYQKSLQQDTSSPRMSVKIYALVLARDSGILDWDDNVLDVVDDRELILARFQNRPNSYNNNSHSGSSNNNSNNNNKHIGANTNFVTMTSSNNNHYLCSEWKSCLPATTTAISSNAVYESDEINSYNPPSIGRVVTGVDSLENEGKLHSGNNGSCLVSISPDSIDSFKHVGETVTADQCCSLMNSETTCLQNVSTRNQSKPVKGSFSLEESDSSPWPVPPPLIVTTTEESALYNKCTYSNALQMKCGSSSNPTDSLFYSKPIECSMTKKNPLKNMTKSPSKSNNDILPATSSLSSSLPSNADAKSIPQSFYSSLESTAVSDNNNSSYDDTNNEEVADSSKSILLHQQNEEAFLKFKSKLASTNLSKEIPDPVENEPNTQEFIDVADPPTASVDCDFGDILEDENSNRSQKYAPLFPQSECNSINSNCSRTPLSLQLQQQIPPPMPPLRSAFTKLSSNPIQLSIQPVNFLQISNSDLSLSPETTVCLQLINKSSMSQMKSNDLSKSEHSIPSLFESEDRIPEEVENEWSLSGKSGDQESMATTTTTETSVNTTTTTTTNSHSTLNKTTEKYMVSITLKKSSNGFGFSLTSRHNPVDLTNPVYVSKVLENGPAIFDGRMKPGDRIVMINDEDVSQASQKSIKDILLNIPVDSVVKIGLFRPSSDAISNLLDAINTASTSQKKNSIPQVLNHTGDKEYNEDCNQICVEEQKPVSFPMCSCIHKNTQPCSKLNLYHFIIPLRTVKPEYLTPQFFERSSPDNNSKVPPILSQTLENKTEPPAIPLNHQNKLSPCSFSTKNQSSIKASNATLGISVRRGISQMSFSDSHIDCHNICHGQTKCFTSSKVPNQDLPESFTANNYVGNAEESLHKFCPNCHGLLSLKNGVFVKAIIPNGAAHLDGRVLTGDEIIAVQGVCLHNGEDFLPPNNKVLLGDVYDSVKFAQVPLKFQNRIHFTNTISSNIDFNDKTDPLTLLKQILSHAQSICSSVSLTILRRSLEQRSCSINTLASVDANCCHNVTVAADIHTPYKNEDFRAENLMNFIMPANLPSSELPGVSSINKQRLERFEEYHSKDHHQRYYRDDRDNSPENHSSDFNNSPENHTSDLICLQSEHGSDDHIPATLSENNSIPSPSHNASLADSYHVSSGILTDFEKELVPKVTVSIYNDSSVIDSSVDNLVTLRHLNINRKPSISASSDLNTTPNSNEYFGAELDTLYFNRYDSTRKSFSQKRNVFKPATPLTKFRSSIYASAEFPSALTKGKVKDIGRLCRPASEMTLYEVPEEDTYSLSSDHSYQSQLNYDVQTVDRKITLRRRSGMKKHNEEKRYRS